MQQLQQHAMQCLDCVLTMPGAHSTDKLIADLTLHAVLQRIQSEVQDSDPDIKQLHKSFLELADWRQAVLFGWDGIGCLHHDPDAPHMDKPVRLFVDGKFVVDAIDSPDLACQFLLSDSALQIAAQASHPGKISMAR